MAINFFEDPPMLLYQYNSLKQVETKSTCLTSLSHTQSDYELSSRQDQTQRNPQFNCEIESFNSTTPVIECEERAIHSSYTSNRQFSLLQQGKSFFLEKYNVEKKYYKKNSSNARKGMWRDLILILFKQIRNSDYFQLLMPVIENFRREQKKGRKIVYESQINYSKKEFGKIILLINNELNNVLATFSILEDWIEELERLRVRNDKHEHYAYHLIKEIASIVEKL